MIAAMTMKNEGKRPSGEMEIDGTVYVTTSRAKEIALEMGFSDVSRPAITAAAYDGNISGAKKLWDGDRAPWVLPMKTLIDWLHNKRERGRPVKDEDA